MHTVVVLAGNAEPPAVADALDRLPPGASDPVVVCGPGQREPIKQVTDASRVVVDSVPDGSVVSAMRAGLRAASTATAVVTTPSSPTLTGEALGRLAPGDDADVGLARVGGDRHPPLGAYAVGPTTVACDTTLATGSERLSNVYARLDVTTTDVDTASPVGDGAGGKAVGKTDG
jgi:molybdopterin-guanine dinucleotide biosynthesis protein A